MDVTNVDDRHAETEALSPAPDIVSGLSDRNTVENSGDRPRDNFPESLFDRCSWFYAICREHLFHDHTAVIARALFARSGSPANHRNAQSPSHLGAGLHSGLHVVEVGCGPGFYATRLAEEFPAIRTTGIDLCDGLLKRAKRRAAVRGLTNCAFHRGDAHALPLLLGRVDAIVVSRLFLVVENRQTVVQEIFRVLRPGGRCFIAEPLSGFRTRVPLACMWLLSKFPRSSTAGYREPQQAAVLTRDEFSHLIASEPWASVEIEYDRHYQYAVCQKPTVHDHRGEVELSRVPVEDSVSEHLPAADRGTT